MESIIKIQRIFLYKRFIKCLQQNRELIDKLTSYTKPPLYFNMFNHLEDRENRFTELQNLLVDKSTITAFKSILHRLYRLKGIDMNVAFVISPQKLLIAWMVLSFPEHILGKPKEQITDENNYPDDIYFITKSLLEKIHGVIENCHGLNLQREFFKKFNQYSNAINYFLGRDRTEQLQEAVRLYQEVGETLRLVSNSPRYSEDERVASIAEISKTQDLVYTHIQTLDNSIQRNDLDIFTNMETLRMLRIEELQYQILCDDIKNKKFIYCTKVINEIKNSFRMLGEIVNDDVLDADMITRKITYTNFSKDDADVYGLYMKSVINKLQSPVAEPETNRKWNELSRSVGDIGEYFATILFYILNEIRDLKENIINVATLGAIGVDMSKL